MHVFDISSLSIIILFPLLWAGKTVASIKDAYGETNYGIKCRDARFEQHEIYAAAKKLCDARKTDPDLTFISYKANSPKPWKDLLTNNLNFNAKPPFYLIPILKDGSLYPIDTNKKLSFHDPPKLLSDGTNPGDYLLATDYSCRIINVFNDFGPDFGPCRDALFEQHEIYAAAKKLCDARKTMPDLTFKAMEKTFGCRP
ncbi:hypothetical protein OnM2_097011 [Erysiphe neolycopersici]|uniref:Uncharacterized protein n=1 Tax=Erysiphe neolycopersici TaxID=212602 RepID=A0A420HAK3_9PEZI|nr:hypothetical protein OnM2_097011 [Erysiphe neolycopersici]